jgi:hypothetical protein
MRKKIRFGAGRAETDSGAQGERRTHNGELRLFFQTSSPLIHWRTQRTGDLDAAYAQQIRL